MALTTAAATELLNLLFENNSWANIGDAGGLLKSVADGSFSISLHTASPGATGSMTNEAAYTSYNPVGGGSELTVARGSATWTTTTNVVVNDAVVSFPTATGGSETLTHFGIHSLIDDTMVLYGALGSSLAVSSGIKPEFDPGDLSATGITAI